MGTNNPRDRVDFAISFFLTFFMFIAIGIVITILFYLAAHR
jgi:hypothetical protein